MCYYQPNKPPCTCAFLQLIMPCDKSKKLPSPNNNPNPLVVVCGKKRLCRGVGQRYCVRCCGRPHPPQLPSMSQNMDKRSHVSSRPGFGRNGNKTAGKATFSSYTVAEPSHGGLDLLRSRYRPGVGIKRSLPPRSVPVEDQRRSTEAAVPALSASTPPPAAPVVAKKDSWGDGPKGKMVVEEFIHKEVSMTAVYGLNVAPKLKVED